MKRALVSGNAGFVGRHMTAALKAAGWDVTGFDTANAVPVDARDYFRYAPGRTQLDLVVHCAAVVGGRTQIEGAPLSLAVNLAIDAGLFEWALRTRPGRVVYISSSAAYPTSLQTGEPVQLSESDIDLTGPQVGTPDLTYGWAKLTGEMLAGHARAEGVPVTVVRPFSGTGPGQALDYPVPAICARAGAREDPLTIWADTARDLIDIEDFVGAILALVDAAEDGPVNLCTGRATRFGALARMAADIVGYSPEISVISGKPASVAYRVGDPTRMNRFYTPKHTVEDTLARMLKQAIP